VAPPNLSHESRPSRNGEIDGESGKYPATHIVVDLVVGALQVWLTGVCGSFV